MSGRKRTESARAPCFARACRRAVYPVSNTPGAGMRAAPAAHGRRRHARPTRAGELNVVNELSVRTLTNSITSLVRFCRRT